MASLMLAQNLKVDEMFLEQSHVVLHFICVSCQWQPHTLHTRSAADVFYVQGGPSGRGLAFVDIKF